MNRIQYILLSLLFVCPVVTAQAGEPTDSLVALPWNKTANYWQTAYNVTPVNMGNVEKSPAYDLRNKMTGIVPGLEITELSGNIMPENNMGNAVITASALSIASHGLGGLVLIVDDVLIPFNQYQFDYNQIESITVLTGAAAKSLYGPRAGYGALYVTTRKGSWNQPLKISADLRAGVDFVDIWPEWVNASDYAKLNNMARENDGYSVLYDPASMSAYSDGNAFSRKYPAVDYKSLMMANHKTTQNFYFDMSGGSNIIKYNASLSGYRSDDIYNAGPISDYNKLSMSSSVSAKVGQWIIGTVSFNGLTGFRRTNNSSLSAFRSIPANAFPVAIGISTNDSDLEGVSAGNTIYAVSRAYTTNPYAQLVDGGFGTIRYRSAMFNAAIDFDMSWLLSGLKSRTMLDFDNEYYQKVGKSNDYIAYYWSADDDITEISTHVGTKQASKSSLGTFTYNNLSFYERLSYDRIFGNHKVDAGAVFFISDGSHASNSFYERQAYAVANVDYSFAGKYFVNLVGQYAGSSRFVAENRYAFFPSVAVGWLVSEEPFLKDVRSLNRLKLSIDAGSIGDADIYGSKYLYRASYVSDSGNSFGPATAYQWFGSDKRTSQTTTISRLANHSLRWPRINQIDIKLEARAFDCLDFTADLYMLNRTGIITETSSEYASMTGLSGISIYDNYNTYLTHGADVSLQYSRTFGDFSLSAGGSLFSWNTIYSRYANDFYAYEWQKITGSSTGSYRGFECIGKFTSEEEIASSALYDPDSKIGDLKYKDINGDGKIDDNDKKIVGNTTPALRCSVNLDLKWKNWSLFIVGTGRFGYDVALTNEFFWNGWGDGNYSVFVRDNIGGDYPNLGYDKSLNNFVASDFWLRDCSYFKIQTAELAYTLVPKHPGVFKSVKFSLRGGNLLTLTSLKYVDPEYPESGITGYPLFRTVAAGVKMNF